MEDSSLLKRPGTRHGVATALQSCPHPHAPQLSRSEVVPPALHCWGAGSSPGPIGKLCRAHPAQFEL